MSEFIKTGLLGHPVAHSKSPLIHNYWIKKFGLEGKYEAFDVKPENLERKIKELIADGYKGVNLTLPHKEAVLKFCDFIDPVAKKVGAVNTLVFEKGKILGFNTDVFGFTENIIEAEPLFDFASGPAVVLGAGGAAHAVIYALLQQNTHEIRLVNRSRERAEEIAAKYGVKVKAYDWEERAKILKDANLVVNTTSLGLEGQPRLDLDLEHLMPGALVNDIVYEPLYTDLLQAAKKKGNPVVTGIGMLLQQARPAFRKWYDVLPDIDMDLLDMVQK